MAEDVRKAFDTKGAKEFEAQYSRPHCIVLDSEYCSMGRMIAVRACQAGGYAYWDAVLLLELVPECGVSQEDVEAFETKLRSDAITKEEIVSDPEYARISAAFDKAINIALAKGPCLIHDRATREMLLEKGYTCVSALTYALDIPAKIVRAKISPLYHDLTDDEEVKAKIHEEDMIRYNYHKAHSDTEWGKKETYDLLINTDMFVRDYSAVILASAMKEL